jgi:hypothetical protein
MYLCMGQTRENMIAQFPHTKQACCRKVQFPCAESGPHKLLMLCDFPLLYLQRCAFQREIGISFLLRNLDFFSLVQRPLLYTLSTECGVQSTEHLTLAGSVSLRMRQVFGFVPSIRYLQRRVPDIYARLKEPTDNELACGTY